MRIQILDAIGWGLALLIGPALSDAYAFAQSDDVDRILVDNILTECVRKSPIVKPQLAAILNDTSYDESPITWRGIVLDTCKSVDVFESANDEISSWSEVDFVTRITALNKSVNDLYLAADAIKTTHQVDLKKAIAKWLVTAETSRHLFDRFPSRRLLALSPHFKVPQGAAFAEATETAQKLNARIYSIGLNLRDGVLRDAWAHKDPSLKSALRGHVSEHVLNLGKMQSLFEQEWKSVCKEQALISRLKDWFAENKLGINEARPVMVNSALGFGSTQRNDANSFKFAVGDVRQLVPWPYALAERLELGRLRAKWDSLSIRPTGNGSSEPPLIVLGLTIQFIYAGEPSQRLEVFRAVATRVGNQLTPDQWNSQRENLGRSLATTEAQAIWSAAGLDQELFDAVQQRASLSSGALVGPLQLDSDLGQPIFASSEAGVRMIEDALRVSFVGPSGSALSSFNLKWQNQEGPMRKVIQEANDSQEAVLNVILKIDEQLGAKGQHSYSRGTNRLRIALGPLRQRLSRTDDVQKALLDELVVGTFQEFARPLSKGADANLLVFTESGPEEIEPGWKESPLLQLAQIELVSSAETALNEIVDDTSLEGVFLDRLKKWPDTSASFDRLTSLEELTQDWISKAYGVNLVQTAYLFVAPNGPPGISRIDAELRCSDELEANKSKYEREIVAIDSQLRLLALIESELNKRYDLITLLAGCRQWLGESGPALSDAAWIEIANSLAASFPAVGNDASLQYNALLEIASKVIENSRQSCLQLSNEIDAKWVGAQPTDTTPAVSEPAEQPPETDQPAFRNSLVSYFPEKPAEWTDSRWPAEMKRRLETRMAFISDASAKIVAAKAAPAFVKLGPLEGTTEVAPMSLWGASLLTRDHTGVELERGVPESANRLTTPLILVKWEKIAKTQADQALVDGVETGEVMSEDDIEAFSKYIAPLEVLNRWRRGVLSQVMVKAWDLEYGPTALNGVAARNRAWSCFLVKTELQQEVNPVIESVPESNLQFPTESREAVHYRLIRLLIDQCVKEKQLIAFSKVLSHLEQY